MELFRSNRTENLADALASKVREDPLGPFEKETIVVQSRGMERWLTLALSERLGSWSNPCFPFPRSVIEQVLAGLSPASAEEAGAYDPSQLKWTIADLLHESAPAELKAYLGARPDADRVLRLAASVSAVFDRYVVYRPARVKRWAKGEEVHWQAELWRRIVERLGPHDLASRVDEALSGLRAKHMVEDMPFKRLHLFSLETLPPLFLELFGVLSRSVSTTLYLLEPSSEYVSDVGSTSRRPGIVDELPGDGQPLLSNLGRLARDFQQLLLGVGEAVHHETDLFETPIRRNLLSSLQADILEFRSPAEDRSRARIDPSDQSISIHSCAGPMREAQVLHDLLGSALEGDPSLRPEDIVVMTPDLERYAAAFRAVFGQDEQHRIPYEVHDRKTRDDASFFDDFLAVLEVLESRFSVLDLVRLLDAQSMREDFRFTKDERSRLTELLAASGIRWGIDAGHREELEFPAEGLHTWRAGLGRLFLGFATTPDTTEVFEGLLPRGALNLGDAELVARLARLCGVLFEFQHQTRQPLDIDTWVSHLDRLCASLFSDRDEGDTGLQMLRSALYELTDLARCGGYDGAIALKTLRREISKLLESKAPAVGFLRRGVTLTELVPLRSVPFRIVCLVGMSEDSFPRTDDRPSFDLTRSEHEPGDRNNRDDDRHSFLQAILCARDQVIITYSVPATSLRSGGNPSPVVWELCEAARRYYELPMQMPVLPTTDHPLHPFDSRYFDGGSLPQSGSRRYLEIARAMGEPSVEPERPELRSEADVEVSDETLSASELATWLWNPTVAFIEKVLRARFGTPKLYEPTSALTEIAPLEASRVGNSALRAGLRDETLEAYLAAAPEFPDGNWGALVRQRLALEIRAVHDRTDALASEHEARSELVAAQIDGLTLEERLDGLFLDQRVLKRFTMAGKRTCGVDRASADADGRGAPEHDTSRASRQ
jgi:exodeoxyribonuclease V gamma subunit